MLQRAEIVAKEKWLGSYIKMSRWMNYWQKINSFRSQEQKRRRLWAY